MDKGKKSSELDNVYNTNRYCYKQETEKGAVQLRTQWTARL